MRTLLGHAAYTLPAGGVTRLHYIDARARLERTDVLLLTAGGFGAALTLSLTPTPTLTLTLTLTLTRYMATASAGGERGATEALRLWTP